MTEGRQPFTAEIKTLAKGPSTYDPLENGIRKERTLPKGVPNVSSGTQSGNSLACPLICFQIDQSNAEVGLLFPSQMGRCVDQHHLERRANRACEKMTATRRAIGQPEDDVNVKAGLAVVSDRQVSDRAQYLTLLSDLDLL